jgi:hypothetical protein
LGNKLNDSTILDIENVVGGVYCLGKGVLGILIGKFNDLGEFIAGLGWRF